MIMNAICELFPDARPLEVIAQIAIGQTEVLRGPSKPHYFRNRRSIRHLVQILKVEVGGSIQLS